MEDPWTAFDEIFAKRQSETIDIMISLPQKIYPPNTKHYSAVQSAA